MGKVLVIISRPPATIQRPHSVNSFGACSECYTGEQHCAVPESSFTRSVLAIYQCMELPKYVCLSYRSDFLSDSCTVNIEELAV
jgi:hypothetical protein